MDKNVHNVDDAFKRAYQSYEHAPSANAWDKINSALDEEDANKSRRRFLGWKRTSVILFCLLTSLLIYETRVLVRHNENSSLREKKQNLDSMSLVHQHINVSESSTTATTREIAKSSKNKTGAGFKLIMQLREAPSQKEEMMNPGLEERNAAINVEPNQNQSPDIGRHFQTLPVEILVGKNRVPRLKQLMTAELPIISETSTLATFLKYKNRKSPALFKPYWSVIAFASNDWSQYLLDNDVKDNSGGPQIEKEKISLRERHEASFSTGIYITRQFSKHFGLKSGIIYSNIAISISPQKIYAVKGPDGTITYKYITSSGYGYVKPGFGPPPAIGDSIQSTEAQHRLHTISVPIMALYRWEKGRVSISPAIGLSANFIARAKIETEIKDAVNKEAVSMNKLNGMRQFYLGLVSDVTIRYSISSRWAFNFSTGLKFAVTPITRGNVVKTFPYSLNVGAGISYDF